MKKHLLAGLFILILSFGLFNTFAPVTAFAQSNTACISLQNNLTYGSRDAGTNGEVSVLQNFLRSGNYLNNEATGFFGTMTVQAAKDFQTANGIESTGFVGTQTRAKIYSLSCGNQATPSNEDASLNKAKKDLTLGSKGDDVKELQQKLKDAGFLAGNVDGIYGPKTRDALAKYNGLSSSTSTTADALPLPSACDGAGRDTPACDDAIVAQFVEENSSYGLVLSDVIVGRINPPVSRVNQITAINKGAKIKKFANILSITSLTHVLLNNNQLTGTIPSLPPSLIYLNLSTNQLTGPIPTLPQSLKYLYLNSNQLTGSLPTLPPSLVYLYLYTNQLTGSIPNIPSSVTNLQISDNKFSGGYSNISSISAFTPASCNVSANNLNSTGGPSNCTWQPQNTPPPVSAPTITSLSPATGPVGSRVVINGSGLVENTTISTVHFGSFTTQVPVSCHNNPSLACFVVPTGVTSGVIYPVSVTNANGTSNPVNFTVTPAAQAPTITSLSPVTGPVGTSVIITGSNFTSSNNVYFGTGHLISGLSSSNSGTKITFTVPTGLSNCTPGIICAPLTPSAYSVSVNNSYGTSAPVTFNVTGVSPAQYTLTVSRNGTGPGTITSNPGGIDCGSLCNASYNSGTTVTLTATPIPGSTFTNWSGACTGSSSTCTVTMTSAKNVTAMFTTNAGPQYSINLSASAMSVSVGTNVSFTATCSPQLASPYVWSLYQDGIKVGAIGTCASGLSGYVFNTAQSHSYIAKIAKADGTDVKATSAPVTVTWTNVASAPTGSFSINNGATSTNTTAVTLNMSVTGAAQMRFGNPGAAFSAWEPYAATRSFTLSSGNGLKTINGEFKNSTGVLQVSDSITLNTASQCTASGTITPSNGTFVKGTSQTFTVNATSSNCTLPLKYAWCVGIPVGEICQPGPAGGITTTTWIHTMNESPGAYKVYSFVYNNAGAIITRISAPVTVTWTATPPPSINPPTIISVSPQTGPVGTNVTIKGTNFTPNNTIKLANLATLNGVSSDGFTTSFTVPATAVSGTSYSVQITNSNGSTNQSIGFTVTAPQSVPKYQLTVSKSGSTGSGTITSSPGGINCGSTCSAQFDSNSSVTLYAMPFAGSDFTRWEGACTGINNACTVTMNSAKNATAIFTPTPVSNTTPDEKVECLGGLTSCVKVTSLSPSSGGVGTAVKITGTGFTTTNSVTIGKTTIPNLSSTNNYTNISFTVPNMGAGSYDLTVTSGKGTSMPVTFTVMAAGSYKVLGAESFHFSRLLERGVGGDEVVELQKFLNNAGYDVGNVDGRFGPKTESALIQFQTANNLKADGKVGPLVRAFLNR